MWVTLILTALIVVLLALFGWILHSSRHTGVEVDGEALRVVEPARSLQTLQAARPAG